MSQMEKLGSECLENCHDQLDGNTGGMTQDGFLASIHLFVLHLVCQVVCFA